MTTSDSAVTQLTICLITSCVSISYKLFTFDCRSKFVIYQWHNVPPPPTSNTRTNNCFICWSPMQFNIDLYLNLLSVCNFSSIWPHAMLLFNFSCKLLCGDAFSSFQFRAFLCIFFTRSTKVRHFWLSGQLFIRYWVLVANSATVYYNSNDVCLWTICDQKLRKNVWNPNLMYTGLWKFLEICPSAGYWPWCRNLTSELSLQWQIIAEKVKIWIGSILTGKSVQSESKYSSRATDTGAVWATSVSKRIILPKKTKTIPGQEENVSWIYCWTLKILLYHKDSVQSAGNSKHLSPNWLWCETELSVTS